MASTTPTSLSSPTSGSGENKISAQLAPFLMGGAESIRNVIARRPKADAAISIPVILSEAKDLSNRCNRSHICHSCEACPYLLGRAGIYLDVIASAAKQSQSLSSMRSCRIYKKCHCQRSEAISFPVILSEAKDLSNRCNRSYICHSCEACPYLIGGAGIYIHVIASRPKAAPAISF